ncbi:MAG: endonuclease domain-containing protein [Bacteroidetes bacterium]|nr:endonuclease domain-containing protein [Bacteroidota bacterium]
MSNINLHKYKKRRQELRNNSTKAEQLLWNQLKGSRFQNLKFRRQQGIGRYIVDFYCPDCKLAIEIDGDSHFDDDSQEYDKIRTDYLNTEGIKVIRFTNTDIYKNIIGVLENLKNVINKI